MAVNYNTLFKKYRKVANPFKHSSLALKEIHSISKKITAPKQQAVMRVSCLSSHSFPKKIVNNSIPKRMIRKNDWDFDGIPNKKDCQPRNVMRQDFKLETTVPIVDSPESYGYTKQTKYMSPDEYMKLAYASHGYSKSGFPNVKEYEKANIFPNNLIRIKEGLRQKEKVVPSPWIETKRGIPVEQEGRHRAIAARELGYKKIPVHFVETERR